MGGAEAVAHRRPSKFLIPEGSSREVEMAFPSMEFFSIKMLLSQPILKYVM